MAIGPTAQCVAPAAGGRLPVGIAVRDHVLQLRWWWLPGGGMVEGVPCVAPSAAEGAFCVLQLWW